MMLLMPGVTVTVMVLGEMFWTKDAGVTVGVTVMGDVRTGGAKLPNLFDVRPLLEDDQISLGGLDAEDSDLRRRRVLVAQLHIIAYEGRCKTGKKKHTPGEAKVHDDHDRCFRLVRSSPEKADLSSFH